MAFRSTGWRISRNGRSTSRGPRPEGYADVQAIPRPDRLPIPGVEGTEVDLRALFGTA